MRRVDDVQHDRADDRRMDDRERGGVLPCRQIAQPVSDPGQYVVLGLAAAGRGGVRPLEPRRHPRRLGREQVLQPASGPLAVLTVPQP